jgi:hypothetical protein
MNLKIEGIITLRSSLAHGAFDAAGSTILPFRREGILQRDADGKPLLDPYAALTADPVRREQLRQIAQRLLRIIWQSKSDGTQWTYAQLAERVAVAVRMKNSLADALAEMARKMGCGETLVYFQDDAEFFTGILAAMDTGRVLYLLREAGERMLIVARLQADSAARHEGRATTPQGQLSIFAPATNDAPETPAFRSSAAPYIAMVPVYSGNALRNGVVRRGAARYILDHFGWRVPLPAFRSLFVGGALLRTGDKSIDIQQRRQFLALMPLYGLLGGPFNRSDMVEGSVKAGKAFPLVQETIPTLPASLRKEAAMLAMANVMATETYSKREDARLAAGDYLADAIVGGDDGGKTTGMVFEREVLIANIKLYSAWTFHATQPLQVGAWISGWVHWAERPMLGGASQMGHGLADVAYRNGSDFLSVTDGVVKLGTEAQHLYDDYRRHLDDKKAAIQLLLEATEQQVAVSQTVDDTKLQMEFESAEVD